MIIADTNVLSEPMRARPDQRVMLWLEIDLWNVGVTAVAVGELVHGTEKLPESRRKRALTAGIERLLRDVDDKIIAYGDSATKSYGELRARRERAGRAVSIEDNMIAAICLAGGYSLATRNTTDFEDTGIELINPWES